jgi:glutamate racemase
MIPDPRSPIPNPSPCPIGVFDSGVGGLSVVRELIRQFPDRSIVYLADQANTPYGRRSLDEIRGLSYGITRFLLQQGACIIVIACNTASAAALRWLRAALPHVPFVGMEPAVKPAVERTHTRHVGVIATPATFQGELFASLLDRFAGDVVVHTQICPDLVPLVEAGELTSERARRAVAGYLAPLLAVGIDELVLGCTHYPFLRPLIEEIAGPHIEIIDPAPAVARQVGRVLAERGAPPATAGRQTIFYTTGNPVRFARAIRDLVGLEVAVRPVCWNAAGELQLSDTRPAESQTYPK